MNSSHSDSKKTKQQLIKEVGLLRRQLSRLDETNKRIESKLAHVSRIGMMAEISNSFIHDLNQPLAAILSNAQMLQRLNRTAGAKFESADEVITDLLDDVYRVSEVVNRIGELLKPGPHKVEIIDLNNLIVAVEHLLASEIIMRRISLKTELEPDLPAVLADRLHLQQVLITFMSNAFDAIEEMGRDDRCILIRSRRVSPVAAEVCVIDNGIGLQPEKLERIFEAFYTTKENGLGLGLAISKSLLQAQGGDIWAESVPQGGAAFYFTVKLAVEATNIDELDDKKVVAQDGAATVYIVDDDRSVQKALKRVIGAAGYHVETFGSAREFLQLSERTEPCCVLVDLHMPSVTGLDLQEQLNNREYTIPIIFISGAGYTAAGVQAIKRGAVDFLSKPVDEAELLATISQAVEIDRQARAQYTERASVNDRLLMLTPREREVLDLVVRGLRNKQIAYELGISEKTVKAHRGQMMRKMEARSLAGLVHLTEFAIKPPTN
jgi:FixJ family two-component response regulator/nitrogen-specific signal transduction histidine kinase